jgi:hypothetical protein
MNEEPITQQGAVEMTDTPLFVSTTSCEHFMAQDTKDTAVCANGCGHGCSFNPDESEIMDGVIIPKKRTSE